MWSSNSAPPKGWERVTLGQLAEFKNGSAFNEGEWESSGLPIIRIQNLNGGGEFNYFQGDATNHVVVDSGDLLFSWSGNRGTSFGPRVWDGPRGVLNQHIFMVRVRKGVEPCFLLQVLREVTAAVEKRAHGGTGIVHVRKSELEGYPVLLPTEGERTAISRLLQSIDDTIDRMREVIEQTRKLKGALLQDLLTNGLPGHRRGQKKHRWLNQVPMTWHVPKLGELLAEPIRNGYSPNCPSHPTGRWILSLSAVGPNGYQPAGVKPAPIDDLRVDDFQLIVGDIVVSRSNTSSLVGLAGVYNGIPERCSYPDLLMRVRVDASKANPDFVLTVLLSAGSRSYFSQTARGTSGSMKKIDRQILEDLPIPLPSTDEQARIVKLSNALATRLVTEEVRLAALQGLKGALSQDLLTGKVRVPTAEVASA